MNIKILGRLTSMKKITHKFPFKKENKTGQRYFRFGLRGSWDAAIALLEDYPMAGRNTSVYLVQLACVNAILSNIPNGNNLIIRNFSRLKHGDRGLSRKVFLSVLEHLSKIALIARDGEGYSRSVITFSSRIMKYIPNNIIYRPEATIFTRFEGERREVAKVNSEERRELKRRLESWWDFVKQHRIDPGITTNDFELFNECETKVFGKRPMAKPDRAELLPYIIFNDRDLTKGGRMYGAF